LQLRLELRRFRPVEELPGSDRFPDLSREDLPSWDFLHAVFPFQNAERDFLAVPDITNHSQLPPPLASCLRAGSLLDRGIRVADMAAERVGSESCFHVADARADVLHPLGHSSEEGEILLPDAAIR